MSAEPRVRHTMRCDDAMSCGHPAARCVCTELERLHDDWKALRATLKAVDKYVPSLPSLTGYARSIAALADLHERIRLAGLDERGIDGDVCPFCQEEEGP